MKVTKTLLDNLYDNLVCVAISANGGAPMDKDGNFEITDEQLELLNAYASQTLHSILSAWEELTEKEWEIIE